jgi:hypothetical protein
MKYRFPSQGWDHDWSSRLESMAATSTSTSPRSDFCYCQTIACLLTWRRAISDERTYLSFTIVAGPRQRSHSRVRALRDSWLYLMSQNQQFNLECHVPVFISPRNRVAQLHPQALGFLFVASYDLQGYDGSIRTRLHAGINQQLRVLEFLYDWWFICSPRCIAPARTAQQTTLASSFVAG